VLVKLPKPWAEMTDEEKRAFSRDAFQKMKAGLAESKPSG
jgi:hypothetical protein